MIEFKLPSLGADMDQGTLLEWKVSPGQAVARGAVMAVVDTAKAAVDVETWQEGTVQELRVQPGETVPVGTVLATLLAPGESASAPLQPPAEAGRARISPAARKRAGELGVAVDALTGTGEQGTITLQDVERAAATAPAPQDRAVAMRASIAAAMSRSKREIPHYYLAEAIPFDQADAWLRRYNAERPPAERMLAGALLLKAVALACRAFPEMNGHYLDGRHKASEAAHLGVAIALRGGGLVAPAIHDADRLSLPDLMRALSDLVQRTRAGSLRSSQLIDPTITVTSLGDQGVDALYGVIHPPQVALVGFGRIREQPWARGGKVTAIAALTASLAADHRVSDGHRGALFLARIRELLQEPDRL